jgi:hypothetical protein
MLLSFAIARNAFFAPTRTTTIGCGVSASMHDARAIARGTPPTCPAAPATVLHRRHGLRCLPHAMAFLSAAPPPARSAITLRVLRIARCEVSPSKAASSPAFTLLHSRHYPIAQHARWPPTIPAPPRSPSRSSLPSSRTLLLDCAYRAPVYTCTARPMSLRRRPRFCSLLPPFPTLSSAKMRLRAGSARKGAERDTCAIWRVPARST